MLSDLEKGTIAVQWRQLETFAQRLPFAWGEEPAQEAARYLRYHHDLNQEEWQAVERFRREHAREVETAASTIEADTELSYQVSGIAMQWCLLFGFAAQYTRRAAQEAAAFLRDWHRLSAGEWEQVESFLQGQEEQQERDR